MGAQPGFSRRMRVFSGRVSGLLLMVWITMMAGCGGPSSSEHEFTFESMGTMASCRLTLPQDLSAKQAEAMVRETFAEVNTALSTWLPNSEISRLSRAAADSAVTISPLLRTCLLTSQQLHKKSQGAFDPTAESLLRLWGFYSDQGRLPGRAALDSALADLGQWHLEGLPGRVVKDKPGTRFDLGGIAKGLAVDLAAARLRKSGVGHGLIDLGGNLYCLGGAPGRENWRVGLRNPHNRDEIFASVTITEASVATSGSYERFVEIDGRRYGHIMNPATGRPAEGLLSATVIAENGILADGLSTTLFVLGPQKALPFLAEYYPQVEAVLVVLAEPAELATIRITNGLKGRFFLHPGFEKQFQVVVED